jgi:hypothetical protein
MASALSTDGVQNVAEVVLYNLNGKDVPSLYIG